MSNDYLDQFKQLPAGLARFKSDDAAATSEMVMESAVRALLKAIEGVQVTLQLTHQRTLVQGFLIGVRACNLPAEADRLEALLGDALETKRNSMG